MVLSSRLFRVRSRCVKDGRPVHRHSLPDSAVGANATARKNGGGVVSPRFPLSLVMACMDALAVSLCKRCWSLELAQPVSSPIAAAPNDLLYLQCTASFVSDGDSIRV
jgi:hypothetical protein